MKTSLINLQSAIMSFEVFTRILETANMIVNPSSYHMTDVHYYASRKNCSMPFGYSEILAGQTEIASLREQAVVLEPFGIANDLDEKTKHVMVVLDARKRFKQEKYGITFEQINHRNVAMPNTRRFVDLTSDQAVSIIILFPMNEKGSPGGKTFQINYCFEESLVRYTDEGGIYFPCELYDRLIEIQH